MRPGFMEVLFIGLNYDLCNKCVKGLSRLRTHVPLLRKHELCA